MVLVASDRAAKQNQPAPPATGTGGDSTAIAKRIAGLQDTGVVAPDRRSAPPPGAPPTALTPGTTAMPAGGAAKVVPVEKAPAAAPPRAERSPRDEELARIRLARMQQLVSGATAKTSVPVSVPHGAGPQGGSAGASPMVGAGPPELDTRAEHQARLAQVQGASGVVGAAGAGGLGAGSGGGGKNSIAQFGNPAGGDRWALASKVEPPHSAFELRAGFVLPAVLMSGINSDLPGQIMAQVSQNVYDTPTGKHVLIPLGSRLVGTYSSDVGYGQARVLIAWQRIDFPDGKALDIGSMPGADGAGYAGFSDKTNNHYVRLFGSAILLSAVTAGISYSQQAGQQPGSVNNSPTAGSAMSEALGQQLGQVTGQLLAKNMNISPTLEIRPGYRFNVMVTKDLVFAKPYKAFDY